MALETGKPAPGHQSSGYLFSGCDDGDFEEKEAED